MIRIFSAVLALAFLAACSASSQKSAQDAASAAPAAAQDALIVASVKTKLGAIDVDSATAVKVESDHGHVKLSGEARSQDQRKQFEDAARSVNGVTDVFSSIQINARMRGTRAVVGDAALATKVMGAIAAQVGVNVVSVKASAKDGVVTLAGTAGSPAKKALILETARGTGGVRQVIDHIAIK